MINKKEIMKLVTQPMRPKSIYEVIAENGDARKINAFLYHHRFEPARTREEAAAALRMIVLEDKKALEDLMQLHPHKEAILAFCGESKSGCCGDGEIESGCDGNMKCKGCPKMTMSSAEGATPTTTAPAQITPVVIGFPYKEYVPVTVLAIAFLVGLNYVLKNK